ncbi:capsid cement protein [Vacuolonema iberomarrocanum]|uniref:capsid cement protein n=1 Tax=Vacuolonema iberomarrocanum TaxID=3454632 RepID=UPI001A08FC8D|nr:DUF2190 family protein [filamentous cyanobacterium LEGE 07170]
MSIRDYGHVRNYEADGAIGAYRIFKPGTAEGQIAAAAAATEPLLGVTTDIDAADGERVDGVRSGFAPVIYGGNVAVGDWLTSDANGAAVATTADGANVLGRAEVAGVAGDRGSVFLTPTKLSTPA